MADEVPFTFGRPRAKRLIYLYMAGGMSHLDTFDPKPGQDVAGPLGVLSTDVTGLQVSELLPLTAKVALHLAVVRFGDIDPRRARTRSLFPANELPKRGTVCVTSKPWHLADERRGGRHHPTLPSSVVIGGGSDHPGSVSWGHRMRRYRSVCRKMVCRISTIQMALPGDQYAARLALSRSLNQRLTDAFMTILLR